MTTRRALFGLFAGAAALPLVPEITKPIVHRVHVPLSVNGKPQGIITATVTDQSGGSHTYQWHYDGVPIKGATSRTFSGSLCQG